jgi:hypothetical protein
MLQGAPTRRRMVEPSSRHPTIPPACAAAFRDALDTCPAPLLMSSFNLSDEQRKRLLVRSACKKAACNARERARFTKTYPFWRSQAPEALKVRSVPPT